MNILDRVNDLKTKFKDWDEKILSLPFVAFDPEWEIKVVPGFIQGIAVFKVRHKSNPEKTISILVDPNTIITDEPTFWEIDVGGLVKANEENIISVPLAETEELLKILRRVLS